jgi:hypothetical protein
VLPRGSQAGQTSRRRAIVFVREDRSLVVNGDAPDRAALGLEGEPSGDVPRIFDNDGVARIQQEHREHVERLLCAGRDDDLVRSAPQAPHVVDVVSDRPPQGAIAVRIAVPKQERIGATGMTPQQAFPGRRREGRGRDLAGDE